MRIIDLIKQSEPFISLEFFPPKERALLPDFFKAVQRLKEIRPLFVSVTYGAMGSTIRDTLSLVRNLKRDFGLETMAHLTCIGATMRSVDTFLSDLVRSGVDNVLALRGDLPAGESGSQALSGDYRCAADLVSHIHRYYPELGIGVAAYPEGHPESSSLEEDLEFLKVKFEMGADFAITQLFFENSSYWDFIHRAKASGINAPLIPGILPIFSLGSVSRIVSLCGASFPSGYRERLENAHERGGDSKVEALGIDHARLQAAGLIRDGAPGVHLYTLNRADACLKVVEGMRAGG